MTKLSTIEIFKDYLHFSSGHFTIFSAEKREKIHGHNYQVYCSLTTIVGENGLTFDYRDYKQKLHVLCRELNEYFLLAKNSPFLRFEEDDANHIVYFNQEKLFFPKSDVKFLPVTNITVEELSTYFLTKLIEDKQELEKNAIQNITIKIFSSPGQSGSATWEK